MLILITSALQIRMDKGCLNIFAYVFGSISAIIMGAGMSLAMTELGDALGMTQMIAMLVGISVGVVGGILASLAYPLHQLVVKREREKIAPEILRLTEELLK